MVHGDAKSACSAAKLAQEQTGPGQNLGVHVDAIAELNAQTATIYVNAHGVGAKDGNQIANQRLFYINAKSNGARVLIIINDCCASKNYIGINSAGLPAFLVLSGLYDLVITIILGIIHSKGMCDRLFGSGTVKSCAGPPVKYVEARQVQPSAYIDIVALLTPILNIEPDSSMPKGSSSRPPTST
ncbi:hypothetical protein T492DRAFT_16138 [Pavlovales sp. CCMP2436]|nr:hypothetical protein T492DRAFT_16138 [Pavlovales sp. CCMP2436]